MQLIDLFIDWANQNGALVRWNGGWSFDFTYKKVEFAWAVLNIKESKIWRSHNQWPRPWNNDEKTGFIVVTHGQPDMFQRVERWLNDHVKKFDK